MKDLARLEEVLLLQDFETLLNSSYLEVKLSKDVSLRFLHRNKNYKCELFFNKYKTCNFPEKALVVTSIVLLTVYFVQGSSTLLFYSIFLVPWCIQITFSLWLPNLKRKKEMLAIIEKEFPDFFKRLMK